MKTVGVVGAGIVGRCCALALARAGCAVTLYERGSLDDRTAVSFVAAGLLAPLSEAATLPVEDRWIYTIARDAVRRWQELLASLARPVFLAASGSLVGARTNDHAAIDDLYRRLGQIDADVSVKFLDKRALIASAPDFAESLDVGLLIPGEGAVHGGQALDALAATLRCEPTVQVREHVSVREVTGFRVDRDGFDAVVDCRGLAARHDLLDLRGVRGELVEVYAPQLHLTQPIRVSHARYPVYIVPRGRGVFIIGATALESEDESPPTVTAVLELLGAIYNLNPAFRQASLTRHAAGVRPAFFDNTPRVRVGPGLLRVNGLFRHGFLLAPAISAAVRDYLMASPAGYPAQLFKALER